MKRLLPFLLIFVHLLALGQEPFAYTRPPSGRLPTALWTKVQSGKPIFDAPLLTSIVLARGNATGMTFTRASTAYVRDFEGILRTAKAGEVRFQGARRVENLISDPENLTAWTKSAGGVGVTPVVTANQTAPDGTTTAFRVQLDITGGTTAADLSFIRRLVGINTTSAKSVWIKSNTVGLNVLLDAANGSSAIPVTTSWQRLAPSVAIGQTFDVGLRGDASSTKVADLTVWHPQFENVTGQSNTNPSEYVSVGVLSSPYHGAMADGVKYFDTKNGNTVSSNVVIESTGPPILTRTNYLGRAIEFDNAAWVKNTLGVALTPVITADAGIAPDGTATADRIQLSLNGGTASADISGIQNIPTGLTNGPYTNSVWLRSFDGVSSYSVNLTSPSGLGITVTVTGSWQRFVLSDTIVGGVDNYQIRLRGTTGSSNVADLLAWGAQAETGTGTTPLIRSVATRLTVDSLFGYLTEGARTNLALQSQTFDNASWVKTNSTVAADLLVAPDATTTGDVIVENATAGQHQVAQSFTKAASALPYALSVYAKFVTRQWAWLLLSDGTTTDGNVVYFDLLNCVTGNTVVIGAGFTTVSKTATLATDDGWCRINLNATSNTATGLVAVIGAATGNPTDLTGISYSGVASTGAIAVWQGQLEQATFPSSNIVTTTASASRAIDVLDFPSTGNLLETGTAFAEYTFPLLLAAAPSPRVIGLNGATGGAPLYLAPAAAQAAVYDRTASVISATAPTANAITKGATTWNAATTIMRSSTNNGAFNSGAYDGTMLGASPGGLRIGTHDSTASHFGTIRNAKIFSKQLDDSRINLLRAPANDALYRQQLAA